MTTALVAAEPAPGAMVITSMGRPRSALALSDPIQQLLQQTGEMQGQLKMMMQVMQQNHDSTNDRINDMRHSVEGQIDSVEKRVEKLEVNERSTAVKSATGSAMVLAAIEGLKFIAGKF